MIILDGKKLADKILNGIKKEIKDNGLKLKLAVILVGDDFASKIYVKKKEEACKKIGIRFELFNFPADISKENLKKEIENIGKNSEISGIIVQLPLPQKLDADEILRIIPPKKNVEYISPVVRAIEYILKEYGISLIEKNISLIGRGKLVGGPLAQWLKSQNLKVFDMDKIKEADVVISGVGKPKIITGGMIKQGAVVIDIGFSHDEKGRVSGDVDFETVSKKAEFITPVPGGVGPITIASLLENLIRLNLKQ